MSTLIKGLLKSRWQPQLQHVRFKNKINITKPRPPHFPRAIVEHLCVPYFSHEKKLPKHIPKYDSCKISGSIKKEEENPFEVILGKEVLDYFNKSKLIAIFHSNSMDPEEKFEIAVLFKRNAMKFLTYGRSIMKKGLSGTIYEPVLSFYQSHTAIAVCKEVELYTLMNIIKKMPSLALMAAVVNNNKLLDYSELEYYGKFPNLEAARTNFLGILNLTSQNIVNQLNYHPNSILQCLRQIEQTSKEKV